MNLDMSLYNFVEHRRPDGLTEIIAISTFAGKPVRGKAICAADDNYDIEKGKMLAAARCNAKIAEKRYKRSVCKINEAIELVAEAGRFYDKMKHYNDDSRTALIEAERLVDTLVSEM